MSQAKSEEVVVGPEHGLVVAKIAAMAILGGCALVCSLVPVLLVRRCSTSGKFLDSFLRFGGGILLATTFLHLLPEVREGAEDLHSSWVEDMPVQLPELLMCIGFFMMYGVEEVAHKFLGHSHHNGEKTPLHEEHSDKDRLLSREISLTDIRQEFLRLSDESAVLSAYDTEEEEVFCKQNQIYRRSWTHPDEDEHQTYSVIAKNISENGHHKRGDLKSAWNDGTPLRAILITLAISLHQVFEGMAVGLEVHTSQVWILTGAITAHKVVIAACIGAEAAQCRPLPMALLLGSFALATPLGVGTGLALSSDSSLGVLSVVLQGLATGTLLYVVFFEVLQRERDGPKIGHFILTAVGFGLMLVLLCFFES